MVNNQRVGERKNVPASGQLRARERDRLEAFLPNKPILAKQTHLGGRAERRRSETAGGASSAARTSVIGHTERAL